MVKVLRVPTDTVPLDPMQTIQKVHWGGLRSLLVATSVAPNDAFLISCSGTISIAGIVVASIEDFSAGGASTSVVLNPSELAALFAPDPPPSTLSIVCSLAWVVKDALGNTQNGTMESEAVTTLSNGDSESEISSENRTTVSTSGATHSFTLDRATYELS